MSANGAVAQLGERMTGSHEVVGSNPISSTKKALHMQCKAFLLSKSVYAISSQTVQQTAQAD